MNTETNFRKYLDVLIRRWQIVVAMPLLAILAAALVTLALKPTYETTATIALAPTTVSISLANQLPPYYLMVNDPRRLPTAYTPTYYVAILKGADVVDAAKPQAQVMLAPDSGDRSLIHVTARGDDPKKVSATATAYALAGAQRIQQLLLPTGEETATAQKRLDNAQQTLIAFARDNGFSYDPTAPDVPSNLARAKVLEFQQLLRERDIAESVYLDFAREYEKAIILANTAYRPTPIPAPEPTTPVSPKLGLNILIGAVFGSLIGLLGAFSIELVARR
jgi:capsular polysaccharide biosynthesis protein